MKKRIAKYPESTQQLRLHSQKWPPVCRSAQKREAITDPGAIARPSFSRKNAQQTNSRRLGALTKFKAAGSMPTSNFSFGLSECHLLRSQFPAVLCLGLSHHFSTALSKTIDFKLCWAKRN